MQKHLGYLPESVCAQALPFSLEYVEGDLRGDVWLEKLRILRKSHKWSVSGRGLRCPQCDKVQCYKDSEEEMSEESSGSESSLD